MSIPNVYAERSVLPNLLKPDEKPSRHVVITPTQQKEGKRLLPARTDAPLRKECLDDDDEKIPLTNPNLLKAHTSYVILASAFMQKMEAMGRAGLEFTEENVDRAMRLIQEITAECKRVEREMKESAGQGSFWETAAHIGGGVIDVASIGIGVSLLASGNPLLVIAGIGMIISGIISMSCLILERTGTKNDITLGFQIAGGVIGLIGGAAFFGTGSGSMKTVLRIALGLITAATHGSQAISYVHQQNNLREEARSNRLDGDLSLNKDDLEIASKLLTGMDEKILENTVAIIQALHRYEDNLRKLVHIQPLRG